MQRRAGTEVCRLVLGGNLPSAPCRHSNTPYLGAKVLTCSAPFTPSMRTSHPFVHPRSDGECPTPTGCRLLPSLRASSTIWRHCSGVRGAYTRSGRHSNVRAQFVKKAFAGGSIRASRLRSSRSVSIFSRSVVNVAGTEDCDTGNAVVFGVGPEVDAIVIGRRGRRRSGRVEVTTSLSLACVSTIDVRACVCEFCGVGPRQIDKTIQIVCFVFPLSAPIFGLRMRSRRAQR